MGRHHIEGQQQPGGLIEQPAGLRKMAGRHFGAPTLKPEPDHLLVFRVEVEPGVGLVLLAVDLPVRAIGGCQPSAEIGWSAGEDDGEPEFFASVSDMFISEMA